MKKKNQATKMAASAEIGPEEPIRQAMETLRSENIQLRRELVCRMSATFQLILSMVDLGRARVEDSKALRVFESIANKVYAISFVHGEIVRSQRLDHIEMAQVIQKLVAYLSQQFAKPEVKWKIRTEEIILNADQAVPLTLALNELISNAFIHGFSGTSSGRIDVILARGKKDMVHVVVRDNGVGMSKDYDVHSPNTFGLRMVRDITDKQLNGKLRVYRRNGTYMKISFRQLESVGSAG